MKSIWWLIGELIKTALVFAFVVFIVLLITGCSTLPEFVADCNGDVQCERRVLNKDENRFQRRETELHRVACVMPRHWDVRINKCREFTGLL